MTLKYLQSSDNDNNLCATWLCMYITNSGSSVTYTSVVAFVNE